MCHTDEECVRRCLDGEPDAYRWLVQRHQNAVQAYMVGRSGNHDLAEEAAQEAFVRAYFSLGRLQKGNSFLPWLLGIAGRAGQELARLRRRTPAAGDMLNVPAPTGARQGPEADALPGAVDRLPAIYKEAILLRYHAGLSCVQMAENLKIPVSTVTKRLSRAYDMLRQTLAEPALVSKNVEVKS
jgi:RNA polymerase sigma-70 factor, ECF subfamily